MYIDIIYNKQVHKINIHKYDSILCIKDNINEYLLKKKIINQNIFLYENNIKNFQLFCNNKLLKNNDYCDKLGIKENDKLNLYLKKKGGSILKKILFYISCIIIIFIPFFILPTGLNTGGVSFIAEIMMRAKNELSRYLICELGFNTLVGRFSTFINFIKYALFILATYTLISIGCITAACLPKGLSLSDDPNKLCTPYKIGSTAGLVLTAFYFMSYFWMRYSTKLLNPIESWAKSNFVTNLLVKPFITLIISISTSLKFTVAYMTPVFGVSLKAMHTFLDITFPGIIYILEEVSKIGCSKVNFGQIKNKIQGELKKMNNENKEKEKSKIKVKNNSMSGGNYATNIDVNKLYDINIFENIKTNGIVDNSLYDGILAELKLGIKPVKNKVCDEDSTGSCCSKEMMLEIGNLFYDLIVSSNESGKMIKQTIENSGLKLGLNLALIGIYEKVIQNDDDPIDFKNKNIIEKKIMLKKYLENNKPQLKINKFDNIIKSIEEYLNTPDNKIDDEFDEKVENEITKYLSKNNLKNNVQIKDIQDKIDELEKDNENYAYIKKENYNRSKQNDTTKKLIKTIFIGVLCNFFTTTNSAYKIIENIGGMNEFMDILKCGSSAGVFIAFIYIIVAIIIIICGFFGVY